jgi:hypothetical protein
MACQFVGIEARKAIVVIEGWVDTFAQIEFPFAQETIAERYFGDQRYEQRAYIERPDTRREPAESDHQNYKAVKQENTVSRGALKCMHR